jgi:hypothetical protein
MKTVKYAWQLLIVILCILTVRDGLAQKRNTNKSSLNLLVYEKERVLKKADKFMTESPVTITSASSPRSAGGLHDFFSEGDYWWPDPQNPEGPYIQKDGMTNPDNFVAHRKAMVRLSIQSATLTAAYMITHETKYALKAIEHFKAWFVNDETKMNPHLLYAQAIKGKFTGRGTGLIDTIHLTEVARSILILGNAGLIDPADLALMKKWFSDYLQWLMTHQYGKDEMNAKNNHGSCWVMQASAFAQLAGDERIMELCRRRFKEVLLPNQMAADGSFPLELARTKPYGYSIFNLDILAAVCQILSNDFDNLWEFTLPDGRNMKKGIEFLFPFIADKSKWNKKPDVMYFEFYPVRQPSLLFGGLAYKEEKFIKLWKTLNPDPENEEVIRNFPIRQPVLWIN